MTGYLDNGNIPVPNIEVQNIEHEVIGDFARTALGTERSDMITSKRIWTIEANYLTYSQYADIYNYLSGINFSTSATFWIDEFGGSASTDSINCRVNIVDDERVQFRRDGTFHDNGRNISLEIIER